MSRLPVHPIFQHLIDQMRVAGLAPPEPPYSEPPRDALLLDDYACSLAGLPVPRAPVLDAERLAEAEQAQIRG